MLKDQNSMTNKHTVDQTNGQISKTKKRGFFQRDENGQIALFVAIIFQIIFVLFALVINVGLLVHHKINLQQSTDLAAYYGAMKQAEILNVIGHINYQMRQAWKLFTWRYRIVGSFAFIPESGSVIPSGIPISISGINLSFDETKAKAKCTTATGEQVSLSDLTPFCIGHNGFGDWGAAAGSTENTCASDCIKVNNGSSQISTIPLLNQAISVQGASVAGAIQTLITRANDTGRELCRSSTLYSLVQLANMMAANFIDSENRQQSIQLLMSALLLPADQMVDIDGESVKNGVLNTLKNNLTDANFNSLGTKYKLFNSTSSDNSYAGSECNSREQLFHELKFQFVDLILNVCDNTSPNDLRNSTFLSLYKNNVYELNPKFPDIQSRTTTQIADIQQIRNIVQNEFKLGYEKNPWCQNYFGVRATTEPVIPFLPLAKIKLHASAFAKPFGGTIGPWFYDKWARGTEKSDSPKQVDLTMPPIRVQAGFGTTLAERLRMLPNFSNYVGDKQGARDPMYQAIFHDFLLTRGLNRNNSDASKSQISSTTFSTMVKPTTGYPFFANWRYVAKQINESDYDPLALDKDAVANSHIRDLEIAAIAPNQFDLTYYSIEPDFYNNYYKNRLDNNGPNRTVDKLKSLTGGSNSGVFRPDFGYSQALSSSNSIPLDYSVRHQLAVVEQIFKGDSSSTGISQLKANGMFSSFSIIEKYFTFIPRFQGSLLTGWTYKDLVSQDGFTQFPTAASGTKMPFGVCNEPYPSTGTPIYRSLTEEPGRLPAASGNCYSGGRTGYSVKIVNGPALNSPQGDIGGLGTGAGNILNPIPVDFFDIQ